MVGLKPYQKATVSFVQTTARNKIRENVTRMNDTLTFMNVGLDELKNNPDKTDDLFVIMIRFVDLLDESIKSHKKRIEPLIKKYNSKK